MAYSKDDRDKVRHAYIFDKLPLDKCASLNGISYPTVRRWKKEAKAVGDDWDKVRTAHTLSHEMEAKSVQILTKFILLFEKASEHIEGDSLPATEQVKLLASLADSYTKITSSNKKMMPTIDRLAIAMTVMEMLGAYIQKTKPEAMPIFVEILVPFGEVLSREFE